MSYIAYGKQSIDQEDIDAVNEVLNSDHITQGGKIDEFEKAVSVYVGAKFGVAVSSGTAALHVACLAAGIKPGDEVITSPITFAASGNCALYLGATIKFADIRSDIYCMDPKKLEEAITPKTRAIIPVDFAGQPCDMDEINAIAKKHDLIVIHDAAHSLGASYKERKVGSIADMTIFSFHPVKHITTGEGGMVVTDNEKFASRLKLYRSHGITNDTSKMMIKEQSVDHKEYDTKAPWYYEMQALGFNYRITDIQCALGLNQLKKLDRFIERRRAIVGKYNEAFSKADSLIVPFEDKKRQSAWHLYILRLRLEKMKKCRREVFEELRDLGIGVHVHYIPLHLQPYYRDNFRFKRGDFPQAEAYYDSAITLPLHPSLSDADCKKVIDSVFAVVK